MNPSHVIEQQACLQHFINENRSPYDLMTAVLMPGMKKIVSSSLLDLKSIYYAVANWLPMSSGP